MPVVATVIASFRWWSALTVDEIDDDPWDAIADGLDDLARIIDESDERLPDGVKKKTVRRLREAIEQARSAADDVEDEKQ